MPAGPDQMVNAVERLLTAVAAESGEERAVREVCLPSCGSSAVITNGLPWLSRACSERWIGRRIIFWPNGWPALRRIAVSSSRLQNATDAHRWWFDLLRLTVVRCDQDAEVLCAAESTSCDAAVARAAELLGRPLLRFELPTEGSSSVVDLSRWLIAAQARATAEGLDPVWTKWRASVSAELSEDIALRRGSAVSGPLGDRLLFACADRMQVLSCRRGGQVAALLEAHCGDPERQQVPVLIAADEHGQLPAVASELSVTAVSWLVAPRPRDEVAADSSPHRIKSDRQQSATWQDESGPVQKPEDWLLHWTRAARGPWPDETEVDLLDARILGCAVEDRSAAATLLKILTDGRLRASSDGIRGGFAVVSLTEVPLSEFRAQRVYRRHRHRFDFESWGIAIRRNVLSDVGARPVIYGDDAVWDQLPESERPYFQKATADGVTDTLAEREWRIVGDLDFRSLPAGMVCVFVESPSAREAFEGLMSLPIIVVP